MSDTHSPTPWIWLWWLGGREGRSAVEENFGHRRDRWVPPERPDWVQRINDEGACMDVKGIVPLDADSLIRAARANTGLVAFGDDEWYEPLRLLTRSFDEESQLTLWGRISTRSDMLLFLEARLRIEDAFKRHPEIADEEIEKPLMIIGQGRSGTSVLHNVLSQDPSNRSIRTWEVMFPTCHLDGDPQTAEAIRQRADKLATQINRVIPEIASMHEFYGDVPTDCAFVHCLTFNSPAWFVPMQGQAPSYVRAVIGRSVVPVYQYEKKLLQLLQWRNSSRRWILKSPYSINHIPQILDVFPDMHFIWPHRDPVKALSSMVNLLGVNFWAKSDHPFVGDSMALYTNADIAATMMSQPIDWLESGILPVRQLLNIQYREFVSNPEKVIEKIYAFGDMKLSAPGLLAMQGYLERNPRTNRPQHRYDVGVGREIELERRAFQRYQEYFRVPSEAEH